MHFVRYLHLIVAAFSGLTFTAPTQYERSPPDIDHEISGPRVDIGP